MENTKTTVWVMNMNRQELTKLCYSLLCDIDNLQQLAGNNYPQNKELQNDLELSYNSIDNYLRSIKRCIYISSELKNLLRLKAKELIRLKMTHFFQI